MDVLKGSVLCKELKIHEPRMGNELHVGAKCSAHCIVALRIRKFLPCTCADALRKHAMLNHCVVFLTHARVRLEVANWVVKTARLGFHSCEICLF